MVMSRAIEAFEACEDYTNPLVNGFIELKNNFFLNTKDKDAGLLEAAGNFFLTPLHYLLSGKTVTHIQRGECQIKQSFDYATDSVPVEILKTVAAIAALPFSLIVGSALKGLSYLDPSVREKHKTIFDEVHTKRITLHNDEYKQAGIPDLFSNERLEHENYPFPEPSEKNKIQMKAAADIFAVLEKHGIPHWLDCGSLLGARRHGSMIPWDNDVDSGIFARDHQNTMAALRELDPEKYTVQDWSCARVPEMFIRVFIKEGNTYLDIYHHDIKDENILYNFSWTDSPWLPGIVKERELVQVLPIKINDIFPLKVAKFGESDVRVPNNWEAFLKVKYGENLDPCKTWNPETKKYDKVEGHPYWDNHQY
jgi:LicD family